jgi:hypothetical protein
LTANWRETDAAAAAAAAARELPPAWPHRYNPSRVDNSREVNHQMTPNWAGAVVNTLVVAFFAVIGIGIGFLVYAAKQLKKAEEKLSSSE